MPADWFSHLEKILPGLLGSMGAMLWIQGSWRRKLALFAFGGVMAWYATPWIYQQTGISEGFLGLMVGLFGMAIVDSVFRIWADLGLSSIVREFIRARLGLPRE